MSDIAKDLRSMLAVIAEKQRQNTSEHAAIVVELRLLREHLQGDHGIGERVAKIETRLKIVWTAIAGAAAAIVTMLLRSIP